MIENRIAIAARLAVLAGLSLAAASAQNTPSGPAKGIALTEPQKQALRALETGSAAKEAAALRELPEAARRLNANLLADTPDPELDQELAQEIVNDFAEAIRLHVDRIREAAKVLTPEQRRAMAEELKKPGSPFLFDELLKKVLGDSKK